MLWTRIDQRKSCHWEMLSALKFTLQPWPGLRNGERGHIAMATLCLQYNLPITKLWKYVHAICACFMGAKFWEFSKICACMVKHNCLEMRFCQQCCPPILPLFHLDLGCSLSMTASAGLIKYNIVRFLLIIFAMVQIWLFPPDPQHI